MKHLVILLVFLSITIVQCGGTKQATYDSNNVQKNQNNEEGEGEPYTGDVKKIQFFDGGWYGMYPNYNIDLILRVNELGFVKAVLDTPECQLRSDVSTDTYQSLIDLVKNSPQKPIPVNVPTAVDRGVHYISLFSEAGENQKLNEVRTFLKFDYPQFTNEASTKIQQAIDALVDDLIEAKGCNSLDIKKLVINQSQTNFLYPSTAGQTEDQMASSSLPPYPVTISTEVTRKFSIELVDGEYLVTGQEKITERFGGCNRNLQDVALPVELAAPMNEIDFRINEFVCMMAPYGGNSLSMEASYGGILVKRGNAGCWNSAQVINHEKFMDGFLKFLSTQEQACWAY